MTQQSIKADYVEMRSNGTDARTVLAALRVRIARLDSATRDALLEELRLWEINRTLRQEATAPAAVSEATLVCPNCGQRVGNDDVLCSHCSDVLTLDRSTLDTHQLVDANDAPSDAYFGPESTLVLMVKDTREAFRLRPQDLAHEVVIGRGAGAAVRPDVDLGPMQAAQLGVSRIHMSIAVDKEQNALVAADLGSANGTVINGQRLRTEEVRVIRHGDELRLGRLVLIVYFQRDTAE